MAKKSPCTCDVSYIYRASIKLKNGKTLLASKFGKRAFRIAVKTKDCFSCSSKNTETA